MEGMEGLKTGGQKPAPGKIDAGTLLLLRALQRRIAAIGRDASPALRELKERGEQFLRGVNFEALQPTPADLLAGAKKHLPIEEDETTGLQEEALSIIRETTAGEQPKESKEFETCPNGLRRLKRVVREWPDSGIRQIYEREYRNDEDCSVQRHGARWEVI